MISKLGYMCMCVLWSRQAISWSVSEAQGETINCQLNFLKSQIVEWKMNVTWEENGQEYLDSSHNSSVCKSTHMMMRVPSSLWEFYSAGEHDKQSDKKMRLRCTVHNQGNVLEPACPEFSVGGVHSLQEQMFSNHYVNLGLIKLEFLRFNNGYLILAS